MENKRILLVGGGGHCKSVLDSLLASQVYSDIGLVEKENINVTIRGIKQVGTDAELPSLFAAGWTDAFITVGSIGNTMLRRKLYRKVKELGFSVPNIADRTAIIAADVPFPEGAYIGKLSVINPGTVIGVCSIINTSVIVEHDCTIGDFVHVSPGSVLCGHVTIGDDTHVGAGTIVRQQLTVGKETIIGIGSVITKNIPAHVEAYGNPCRVVSF